VLVRNHVHVYTMRLVVFVITQSTD